MDTGSTFVLGSWTVLPELHRLRHEDGTEHVLEPKAMQVLECLAARPGEVVGRGAILEAVWPGEYVTEYVLSRSISSLRKALGDDHKAPTYIETIRKGGFRLVAPVAAVPAEPAEPAREARRPARRIEAGWGLLVLVLVSSAATVWWASRPVPEPIEEPETSQELPRPLTSFQGTELDPVLSPNGERLAFSWSGADGTNFDIYVQSLDDATPSRRTFDPAEDKNPAWSPDGERIAFVRSSEGTNGIFVVTLLGGSERKLADCVSGDIPDLVWSADGRHLFFPDRERPGEPSGIFRLDVETLTKQRLTRPAGHMLGDRDLTVSPEGRHMAFARAVMPGIEDLYTASVEGDDLHRLTFDGTSINGLEWLPESSEILFSSYRDGTNRMWRIAVAGGDARPVVELGEGVFDPSAARRGGRLVYERKVYESDVWELEVLGGSEAELRPLIASTRWDSAPALSPDGEKVAFVSDRSGRAEIWIAERDGSNPLRITRAEDAVASAPQWSPDGEQIVFASREGPQSDLYLVGASGGRPVRLTSSTWSEVLPSFSNDGRWIYFSSDQTGQWQIWRMGVDAGEPVPVTREGGSKAQPSQDGETLYYSRQDRPGIWRVPVDGGSEVLVFSPETPTYWADWTLVGQRIYFRTLPANPVIPSSLFVYDLRTATSEAMVEALPGTNSLGLGLTATTSGDVVILGIVDRSDGDVMLVEDFR